MHKPELIAITETWLNKDYNDTLVTPDGYELFRYDRGNYAPHRGGGVAIYVKLGIKCILNNVLNLCEFRESLWINIEMANSKPILVGVCYRSPLKNEKNDLFLLTLLDMIDKVDPPQLLLMGDFNLPNIDFSDLSTQDPFSSLFIDKLVNGMLVQHVHFPTRYMNDRSSILDLILSNDDNSVDNMRALPPLGNSDHICILFDFILSNSSVQYLTKPKDQLNYWKGDYSSINEAFQSVNWFTLLSSPDIETNWMEFKKKVNAIAEKYVPIKKSINNSQLHKPKWLTKNTLKAIKAKKDSFKKFRRFGRLIDRQSYKAARNRATFLCHKDKADYENNLIKKFKENPKLFYSYCRKSQSSRTEISCLDKTDGTKTANDAETANVLNSYFQSVFTKERDDFATINFDDRVTDDMALKDIGLTEDMVLKQLINLKSDKTPGVDKLHPHCLKSCPSLSKPLFLLYRQSLDLGTLPTDWKKSNISPIHKKGSKTSSSNYRPVALTSIVCKILETILKTFICDHIENYKLLSAHQHGFQNGRSCLTNLLEAFESWTRAIDSGDQIDCIYIDFAKAFDTVPFERLLLKLHAYGIRGIILKWIRSFVIGSQMRVRIRDATSEWVEVESGVPQGSVLGPILFILFVNDITESVNCSTKVFADDTKRHHG